MQARQTVETHEVFHTAVISSYTEVYSIAAGAVTHFKRSGIRTAYNVATTTPLPYVDLGEDCQNAYCEPLNSACVTKSNSSRVCECANQYVQVNTTSCQEVPKEVTSQSSLELFVSNEETGNIGEIFFDGLSEFSSLFTTTADIIPNDMKIELTIATDKLSLKLLTPVASTVTYAIVLSATTDSGQYAVQQVVTVRLNVTTVVTPFTPENIPTFVSDGTRKDALIADGRYLGYLLGNDVYTYGIESSTGDIQTLFGIDGGTGQVVCNRDIQLPNDTVAQEYSFNITAQTDGGPKVTIASVYVLVLRDECEINVDENVAGIFMQYGLHTDVFEITETLPTDVVKFTNGSFGLTTPRDYEDPNNRTSKITLSVKTFDNAQQTSIHVVLNVNDVNDVPPTFQDSEYTAFILAGSYARTIITAVSCTDPDTVGTMTYDLHGNYANRFLVDELGVVKSSVDLTKSAFGYLFSLNVSASDGKHQSSNTAVININLIQIVPADKHLNKTFHASIEEEVTNGTYLISVATENYSDYKFVIRQTNQYLTLNSTTGIIETRSLIDREDPPDVFKLKYQEIEAIHTDEDECFVTILGKLYITVEDINDNYPTFKKTVYQGNVKEHSQMGTIVSGLFDLRVTDEDIGANAKVRLTLSGEGSDNFEEQFVNNYFSLAVKKDDSLDRENVPYFTLTLTATDSPQNQTHRLNSSTILNITITDVNDNKPIFQHAVTEAFVIEGELEKRMALVTVTATDEDEGANADISYTITDGGFGLFDISSKGEIFQTQTIDRETRSLYNLTISASDKGSPSLQSTTMVTVNVNDINDNKPEFENGLSSLYFERPEEQDCKKLNITIMANDPDEGDNGTVTYSLNSTTFSITPDTGVITCNTPLDYEKDKEFEFIVTATDNGPEPMSARMTVKVRVTDENDNYPIFSQSLYNTSVPLNLLEGGKLLLAISVSDEDSGDNADISLSLSPHNDIFSISSGNTGVLRVRSVTKISESTYNFNVTAIDKGQPSKSSTTSVTVQVVESVEDSLVNYQNKNFTFFIAENMIFSGKVIGNVQAPVAPEHVNYTIVGGIFDGFELIQRSGELRCNKTMDREDKSEYQIFVKAIEPLGMWDLTMVTVLVTDVNDNHPQFELEPNRLLFQPFEDIANNTLIVRVPATDNDDGSNGTAGLVYKILNTDAQTPFTIDQHTAEIRTTARLDRETKDKYSLNVQVSDGGTPALSSTTVVTVQLKDVNDNPPQFTPATYTKRIWENGTMLDDQFVFATDLDTEYHGPITYFLNTSVTCPFQTTDHFNVTTGEVKGLVSVGRALDYEKSTQYECHVYAVDMERCIGDECQKRLTGTATMTVIILDNNDNAPVFHGTPNNVNVSRDDDIGTVVVDTIMATDADSGRNGLITLSIVSDTEYFLINSSSGEITVRKSLFGLEQDVVILTVEATDNPEHDQPLTTAVTIRINITDDNIRPWFIEKNYTASLTEERMNSDFRVDLTANDSKEGETITCNCTYRIISSGYSNHFAINERTAIVSQVTQIDRENVTGSDIILEIEATDDGEPLKSIKTSLTIRVIDINDNKPYFKNETHRFSVFQTAENGSLIGQLQAFDADEEHNSLSVYYYRYLNIGDSKRVKLHENGTITVTGSLENEGQTYYIWFSVLVDDSVDLEFSDDTQYPQKSITLVNITVTFDNPNKHAPKFRKAEYKKDLEILSKKDTLIEPYDVEATDDDGDAVTYKITEGNSRDIIHISDTSGKMKLNYRLDDTVGSQINLTVIAVDNAPYPKTGTCSVRITVTALEPTQCVSAETYKRLGKDSEQKDLYLGLFAAMASLLAIAFVATIVSCYKWRRGLSNKNVLRKYGIDDKGKLTDRRTEYDRPSQPPSEHPYSSAQRTDFHEGKINPGYVSSGLIRERVPCRPPPSDPEPLPDYNDIDDVSLPGNQSTRPPMFVPALRETSRSYQRSRNGFI